MHNCISKKNIAILILTGVSFFFVSFSCNRTTTADKNKETENSLRAEHYYSTTTAENPFEYQPNEFCTVIRKIDVTRYAPEKEISENELRNFPPRYCLLDVCLDNDERSSLVVNLGDSSEQVMATFQIIKVFDTETEARDYASQHGIKDVVIE